MKNLLLMVVLRIPPCPAFKETKTPQAGDLIFFPSGTNSYEVKKKNNRVYPAHVGIVLDDGHWIGSQTSTGVAQVPMSSSLVGWTREEIFQIRVHRGMNARSAIALLLLS